MAKSAGRDKTRLQKFLSDAGIASRRRAEELILDGHVLVNDEIVDELPAFVDPEHDKVIVDGSLVHVQPLAYYIVHKPPGVVCTNRDPAGRMRAVDLLPPLKQRLFPVGRLDQDSSGLLLMTNDGELAERVTHPRFGVPKVYQAEVRGRVPADLPQQLKRGVHLSEGKARASAVEIVRTTQRTSILLITLREGRNRQIRRMLARLAFPVRKLKRLSIGPLTVKGLPVGAARRLTAREVNALREALEEARSSTPRKRRRPTQSRPAKGTGERGSTGSRGKRPAKPGERTTSRRIVS